jgi:hypothetical protein
MFQFVRRIVAALLNRKRPSGPPSDPYATVWEPRRRNPNGRSSAVALAEPERRKRVQAVGRPGTQGNHADSYEGSRGDGPDAERLLTRPRGRGSSPTLAGRTLR